MNAKRCLGVVFGAVILGNGLQSIQAADSSEARPPPYRSSIRVPDRSMPERGEAARLASLATIDATRATSAALASVPGTVLKVALDNENGNLVYSVEVRTASNEVKDVKVDAGNGAVLHVDAAGVESDADE